MSNVEKGMIIAFFIIFGINSTVSSPVGCPWSTVKHFLHRYFKRGTVENLTRIGQSKILRLTKRGKRTILRAVLKKREYTRERVRRIYAPHVFLPTFNRMFREHNTKKWLTKKRPKLAADHAKARHQWALAHKDWTVEDFQRGSTEMSATLMSANGSVTARVCRSLLRRWLLPVPRVEEIRASLGNPSSLFHRENACIHTAKPMPPSFE